MLSINHILSQYEKGKEQDGVNKMIEFWNQVAIKNSELVKSWSWGIIYGFFYENSLYDASALYDFIEEFFKYTDLKRHINIGLANVLSGRFHSFAAHHNDLDRIKIL